MVVKFVGRRIRIQPAASNASVTRRLFVLEKKMDQISDEIFSAA